MVAKIALKKKRLQEAGKRKAQKVLKLLLKKNQVSDAMMLTSEGRKFMMDQVNAKLAEKALGPYMIVQGPNREIHLRIKKPNRKLQKRNL